MVNYMPLDDESTMQRERSPHSVTESLSHTAEDGKEDGLSFLDTFEQDMPLREQPSFHLQLAVAESEDDHGWRQHYQDILRVDDTEYSPPPRRISESFPDDESDLAVRGPRGDALDHLHIQAPPGQSEILDIGQGSGRVKVVFESGEEKIDEDLFPSERYLTTSFRNLDVENVSLASLDASTQRAITHPPGFSDGKRRSLDGKTRSRKPRDRKERKSSSSSTSSSKKKKSSSSSTGSSRSSRRRSSAKNPFDFRNITKQCMQMEQIVKGAVLRCDPESFISKQAREEFQKIGEESLKTLKEKVIMYREQEEKEGDFDNDDIRIDDHKATVVRFAKPLVTLVKHRPFTDPEDVDKLFFDEDELDELEYDRNTVSGDQFECIAQGSSSKKMQVAIAYNNKRALLRQKFPEAALVYSPSDLSALSYE